MTVTNTNTDPNVYGAGGNTAATTTRQLANTYAFRLAPDSWCGWYDNVFFTDYLVIINGSNQRVDVTISGENGETLAREQLNSRQSQNYLLDYKGAFFVQAESAGFTGGTGEIVVLTRTLNPKV